MLCKATVADAPDRERVTIVRHLRKFAHFEKGLESQSPHPERTSGLERSIKQLERQEGAQTGR
jgi:hypothetical protein